jgi:hypothetical protein
MKPRNHTDDDIQTNARMIEEVTRAYERGRWLKGLRTAMVVVPLMFVSFGCCGNPRASIAIGVFLAGLITVLVWRGGSASRAVPASLAGGIAALAIPLLACPACDSLGVKGALPFVFCVVGGIASGAIVVSYAARESTRSDKATFVFAGGAIAALAGSLGCVVVGLGGVAAMAIGLALVTPLVALRGARQSS